MVRNPKKHVEEVSAGGVVFKRVGKRVYFAMMKDSYKKWTFPKGHVERGEDVEEAAARETLEELGLQEIRFLEELGKIDIWFRDRFEKQGVLIHKDIHYFLFEASEDAKLFPDPKHRAFDGRWVPLSRVLKTSDYIDLKPIIQKAITLTK